MTAATDNRQEWIRYGGMALLTLAVLVLLWKFLPVDEWARSLVAWFSSIGRLGYLAFFVIYVCCALVGFPLTPLNVGAGILFSYPVALAVVLASATVSFFLTFEIARHAARDWVIRRVESVPNAERVLKIVEAEGFKFVFLLRMNPFIPAVIKGYGFGTTTIPLLSYMAASFLGFLPIGLAHVYLGWVGGYTMLSSEERPDSWQQGFLIAGAVVSLVLVAYVTWLSQRRFKSYNDDQTGAEAE